MVVEAQVEPLEVFHELLAQVEHGELSGVLHDVHLDELGDEGSHQDRQIEQSDAREAGPGIRRQERIEERRGAMRIRLDVSIHRDLGEQRAEYLEHRLGQQEHQRDGHQRLVRAHVAQQPAHQPPIVGFAEDLFFHRFQSNPARPRRRAGTGNATAAVRPPVRAVLRRIAGRAAS